MLNDLLRLADAIRRGPAPSIARTEIDGFIISTINSYDCGLETAIIHNEGTSPVERNFSIEEAKNIHNKWVDFIVDGNRKIIELGYGSILGDEEKTIEPME